MGRARIRASELVKVLNASPEPVYAMDEDRTLVFLNQACLDWIGRRSDEMVGLRCGYHTGPELTGPEAAAAALCPSPEISAGKGGTATVCSAHPDGRVRRRRARVIPVAGRRAGTHAVLVVLDQEDLPEDEPGGPREGQSEAAWLHERIQRLRLGAAARFRPDHLLGKSPAMRRARAQVAVAAGSAAPVLIVGPPGSGRQRVAGTIHYAQAAPGTLIPLACSVLGPELIGSTVRAAAQRESSRGRGAGGTLLLNDVDQLPPEAQGDVASVVTARAVPLRLIATAGQPLEELAEEGRFHRHLAAWITTLVIRLPPLVQRREDLPLLAQAFLEEVNSRSAKQVAGFRPEALDWLDGYHWPGNLDELARMVGEAHARAEGPLVGIGDLPRQIHLARQAAAHPRPIEEEIVLDEFLARVERELIQRAMAQAKGNKAQAARLLGMTRPRLYRRLVQLGLQEEPL